MTLRTKTVEYGWGSDQSVFNDYFSAVFLYDAGASSYSDETADAQSATAADVSFVNYTQVGDLWYFGCAEQFGYIMAVLTTAGTVGNVQWEYWNGTTWTNLTVTDVIANSSRLLTTGNYFYWSPPTDWAQTTVNGTNAWFVRARVTTAYTVVPSVDYFAPGVIKAFSQKRIYLPETTGRTIKSAFFRVAYRTGAGAASIRIPGVLMQLDSNAPEYGTIPTSLAIGNTGETLSPTLLYDITTAFSNRLSAGATYIDMIPLIPVVQYATGTNTADNVTVNLFVTYEYNDTHVGNRIKTVHIPIESPLSSLTASLAEIGTNQVPALDTYLPEAGKVYRDIYFEIQGNDAALSTTDWQLGLALDNETEWLSGLMHGALTSATYDNLIWSRNDMNTSAAHAFKARTTTINYAWKWLTVVLVVTYEFNPTTTSRVMQSVWLPVLEEPGYTNNSAADGSRAVRDFYVPDNNPTLSRAGLMLSFADAASVGTLNIKCDTQGYRGYVHAAFATCGAFTLMHDCTSGITFGKGKNRITIDWYATASNTMTQITGCLIINYVADKAAAGVDVMAHTVWNLMFDATDPQTVRQTVNYLPVDFHGEFYRLAAFGFLMYVFSAVAVQALAITIELLAGEADGDGYTDVFSQFGISDAEGGWFPIFGSAREKAKRFPSDTDTDRFDPALARNYKYHVTAAGTLGMMQLTTYHQVKFPRTVQVSGYTGDGSGITVKVFRSDTDEYVVSGVTGVGGVFNFDWWDDAIPLYVTAAQGVTVGRSLQAVS